MSQDYGVWIAFFLLLLIWTVENIGGMDTYKADVLFCAKWDESKTAPNSTNACLQKIIEGSYRIAINKSAGGCAVMYRNRQSGMQSLYGGSGMAYMDSDNWECKIPPSSVELGKIFRMNDGSLSVYSMSSDGIEMPARYDLARSDGIWGNLSHYWRIADQYLRKH